jgi:hypothetical protein
MRKPATQFVSAGSIFRQKLMPGGTRGFSQLVDQVFFNVNVIENIFLDLIEAIFHVV